jgi:hypothetical protein
VDCGKLRVKQRRAAVTMCRPSACRANPFSGNGEVVRHITGLLVHWTLLSGQ